MKICCSVKGERFGAASALIQTCHHTRVFWYGVFRLQSGSKSDAQISSVAADWFMTIKAYMLYTSAIRAKELETSQFIALLLLSR